ncbi:hypothetical protein B0A48_00697 [Cryoendolithus antarcticus]|uniref:Spindle pole body component n=1 Tax=Cryoendolithus antarcticus TaxID=1507870 RepID=A0A1V8TVH8_9PEZI|nr:hypothetical protein B0A48_00697 [Cryoendolithus antarcticus]
MKCSAGITEKDAAIGMAHAGQLNDLAEGLIGSITAVGKKDANFAQLRSIAVKGLREHSHARTNQFDVKAKLDGLVEKFAVLDRDDLSESLQDRLNELPARDGFLPEVLSLLMLLSDRPVFHTNVNALDNPNEQETETKALTWAELIADDPPTNTGLWDDVARGYYSSGDEAGSDDDSARTASTSATSINESSVHDLARQYVVQPSAEDQAALQVLHTARGSSDASKQQIIPEFSVVRQSLQMLRGLDTDLFAFDHMGKVTAQRQQRTSTATITTTEDVTQTSALHPCALSQLVTRGALNTRGSFALLDVLYDLACAAQLEGNEEGLEVFSRVLLDTVRTYLRPMATWLRTGTAEDKNESFFVEESKAPCEPAEIWHSKYRLRHDEHGQLVAPKFLHNKLAEIFAMGKATMFLKQLSNDDLIQNSTTRDDAEDCDVMLMSSRMLNSSFTPYSHFFDEELAAWISNTGEDCAPRLKLALLHDHGVLGTLTTLSHIYSSADAVHTGSFAEALYERIERRLGTWRDAFLITELARNTIGNGSSVIHKESLTAVVDGSPNGCNGVVAALESLSLQYYFTWPVQNITRERTSAIHARALTLLLQTLYAQRYLRKPFTTLRLLSSQAQGPASESALKLGQALMAFCDVLHTYITTTGNVLTAEAHAEMVRATGVDDMVEVYATYIARVERALLLGANVKPVRDAIVSNFALCERFVSLWDEVSRIRDHTEADGHFPRLQEIDDFRREYKASLSFATAGVRSLSRVGGEAAMLEMLADRLEWLAD